MSIYMKADGIKGSVSSEQYSGMIKVQEAHFEGINNGAHTFVGQDKDRITRHPSFGKIRLVKPADISSTAFFQHAHSGQVISSIELHFVSSGNPAFTYQKTKLTDVIVSHYSFEHHDESQASTEYLILDYTSIEQTFIPRNRENKPGNPLTSGYNLSTAKSM